MSQLALGSPWLLDTVHMCTEGSRYLMAKLTSQSVRALITRTDFDCVVLTFPHTVIASCAVNTNPVQTARGGGTIQVLVLLVHKGT